MYKVIIIDDERLARAELKRLIELDNDFIIEEASTYKEAITMIEKVKPDFIFLDVQLNGEYTGFDVLQQLSHLPFVIFTTAYNNYAINAFKVHAVDYILKPMDIDRINISIDKVVKEIELKNKNKINNNYANLEDQIFVGNENTFWFVKIKDIIMLERNDFHTKIYLKQGHAIVTKKLSHLEEKLDPNTFFRANRQKIINLNKVVSISADLSIKIKLENEIQVVLSRRQAIKLRANKSF